MLGLLALIIGLLIGLFWNTSIPPAYWTYIALLILVIIDSLMYALAMYTRKIYDQRMVYLSLVANFLLAACITALGDQIGLQLYLCPFFAFGVRIFQNFGRVLAALLENVDEYNKKRKYSKYQKRRDIDLEVDSKGKSGEPRGLFGRKKSSSIHKEDDNSDKFPTMEAKSDGYINRNSRSHASGADTSKVKLGSSSMRENTTQKFETGNQLKSSSAISGKLEKEALRRLEIERRRTSLEKNKINRRPAEHNNIKPQNIGRNIGDNPANRRMAVGGESQEAMYRQKASVPKSNVSSSSMPKNKENVYVGKRSSHGVVRNEFLKSSEDIAKIERTPKTDDNDSKQGASKKFDTFLKKNSTFRFEAIPDNYKLEDDE